MIVAGHPFQDHEHKLLLPLLRGHRAQGRAARVGDQDQHPLLQRLCPRHRRRALLREALHQLVYDWVQGAHERVRNANKTSAPICCFFCTSCIVRVFVVLLTIH